MVAVRIVLITFYFLGEETWPLFVKSETGDAIGECYEDAHLETPQLIKKYGYPVETHEVQTQDGYLLTMHRIPKNKTSDKAPVLLQHGLLSSSVDYVIIGPGKALAYLLADEGYDVWMGNARGNVYSRKHNNLDPSLKQFWQFSWHEIGVYDLPAMIDYVLEVTSENSLYYIGHSQGTTSFYVMASEKPEYNQKIRLHVSLSPVVFMSHLKSPAMRFLAPFGSIFKNSLEFLGGYEFLPRSDFFATIKRVACRDQAFTQPLCSNLMFQLFGFDSDQLNATALPVILSHVPAGASTLQMLHYGQLIMSGKFRQFDRGLKNLIVYGQWSPYDYDLKKVTVPVVLMYSVNDWMADIKDVEQLYQTLPKVVLKYKVPHPNFNHMDYLYAKDVRTLVYEKILDLLPQY